MRADLARFYGISLNGLFTGEYTPDECWDLLMHLPRDSATVAAIADDEDLAGEPGPPRPPRLTEFGPEVEVLAGIYDLLASLLATVASLGGQPPKIDPYPRPVPAAAATAQREHEEQQERLRRKALAQLLPHKYGGEEVNGVV